MSTRTQQLRSEIAAIKNESSKSKRDYSILKEEKHRCKDKCDRCSGKIGCCNGHEIWDYSNIKPKLVITFCEECHKELEKLQDEFFKTKVKREAKNGL